MLETVQHIVVELVPRCRELITARLPRTDVETWTLAVQMLAGGYSGTLMDLLTDAAAAGTPVDDEEEPTT
ncbi:hypothetical protein ACIQPP_50355 [Streptomyces violaceusniger]|uniref:hypothetical protein n=1 Tax=Streptomyces violaceusniger TaxID=68280 RepID=UPI00099704DF|nr:hypothetical protein [Streptomyces hygroscopicus]